jgi:dihydrolipoamide dehydrogenase
MAIETFDTAIIGAGTAGLAALREVQRHTDRFVIINDGPYGTTCARVGCMPSKALIESANTFHRRTVFAELGIRGVESLVVDVPAVLERVRRLRDHFVAGTVAITDKLEAHALETKSIAGRARFVAPDTLEVNGKQLRAKSIVIATGSRPVVPKEWSVFGDRILTTDTLFEQNALPKEIAVIGMGVIGAELAQALARLGISVSAFGADPLIAGLTDEPVNAALVALLGSEFALHLGEKATLSKEQQRIRVTAGDTSIVVDAVLAALGRRPNIEGLGLELLGVQLNEHGMPQINRRSRQIGALPIYLAGDAADDFPVLHEATDDGYIAGTNAMSNEPICFERRTPLSIVFCAPNAAMIGVPFKQLDVPTTVIGAVSFDNQGRASIAAENHGMLRIYASRKDGRLLGAELCAPRGEHLAHLLALAIDRQLTVQDLLRMPFYHPVFEEGLRTALRDLSRQVQTQGKSDLAMCNALGASALE